MPEQNSQRLTLEKRRVRASFDAAAEKYDDVAVLQREIGNRIIERLELVRLEPKTILDIGAGTGVGTESLSKVYKNSRVIAFDLAPNMLKQARQRGNWLSRYKNQLFNKRGFICGDAEYLPFADNSFDLIYSNATLQWCTDLDHTFSELKRILRPNGLLMFSTFGPDTLKELRASWKVADTGFNDTTEHTAHVHDFIDMHDIGDAMMRAGLAEPVMDVENFTLTYPDAYQLMRELKTLGANNVTIGRRNTLTGKNRINNMIKAYESFRTDGFLPATYEVVYGHAWAPTHSNSASHSKNEVSIPIDQLQAGTHR
jgi:malonyl-CoA O-methyltransferase